jgi:hypothetical protein
MRTPIEANRTSSNQNRGENNIQSQGTIQEEEVFRIKKAGEESK